MNSPVQGFEHFRLDFIVICILQCFDIWEDFGRSDGIFLSEITSCMSHCVRVAGFKRSLKYSLHLPKMYSSLLSAKDIRRIDVGCIKLKNLAVLHRLNPYTYFVS